MDLLRGLSLSFVSGCVGAVGFFVGAYLFIAAGLIDAPAMVETFRSAAFFYKQTVWGGVWGLLLTVPLLRPHWWVRGPIVGTLATVAAVFVFGADLSSPVMLAGALILNAGFWGLTAAFWHDRVVAARG